MKRKSYYLFALALPALLAGCQQEELVSNSANNDGMKLLENPIENFSLKVETSDDVQTRMTDGAQFEAGDEMGLVWFNPWYLDNQWVDGSSQDVWEQLDRPQFYANNRMTINAEADGSGVWTSDAVIMEGTHFAYFPFQTKWGDEYLQVKGGKEILKVYNAETQPVDVNDRLDWLMNHQTLLSPVYEFTEDNGGAGISDGRAIRLELFSNRLNIQPVFENFPPDLTVHSFELKTVGNLNQGRYTAYDAFVTEAEILANKLPMSADFGSCNWATIGNPTINLADFYAPTELTNSLTIEYSQDVTVTDNMDRFTFLLLPVNAANMPSKAWWTAAASEIQLVAHTNYGDITINTVNGIFNANMTTKSDITLSQLYYNAENGDQVAAADQFVGLVGNAGTTRGGSATGSNNNKLITATFDFNDVVFALPTVCDNDDLFRALEMIKAYKEKVGDSYTVQTITLCPEPTFTDLAFSKEIDKVEEETGVAITVTGAEEGSVITWKGVSSISDRISKTTNIVEGTLTANVETGKGLRHTTVKANGTLQNYGIAERVNVEANGRLVNDGKVTTVYNYGTVYNNPALTNAPTDQPTIESLYNYATVENYAAIESVEANENEEGTAVIILKNNPNPAANGTFEIGAIFNIEEVYKPGTNIQYTVESNNPVRAASDLATALNNYATNVFVADGVNIDATSSETMNDNEYGARITFLGATTYTMSSSAQFDNTVRFEEIVLAENAQVEVKNQLFDSGRLTNDVYALAASRTALNDGSQLTIGGGAMVATYTLFVQPNASAAVKTDFNVNHSGLYYIIISTEDAEEFSQSGNVNVMPYEIKAAFGWN